MSNSNYDIVKELMTVVEDTNFTMSRKLPLDKREWAELMGMLAQKGKKAAVAVGNSVVAKATKK
jgi:hypothetical protein